MPSLDPTGSHKKKKLKMIDYLGKQSGNEAQGSQRVLADMLKLCFLKRIGRGTSERRYSMLKLKIETKLRLWVNVGLLRMAHFGKDQVESVAHV